MREIEFGGLRCRVLGGVDGNGSGKGPVVVLLHGFGAPGTDLVGLEGALDVGNDVRFVFPEAPIALGRMYGNGRAWWQIDMLAIQEAAMRGELRSLAGTIPPELAGVRAQMIKALDEITEQLSPSALFLGGFSQGAMLSCDVALHDSRKLAGLVILSGTLMAETEWAPRFASRKDLPIFQSHGTHDPILPYVFAEALRDAWDFAGSTKFRCPCLTN